MGTLDPEYRAPCRAFSYVGPRLTGIRESDLPPEPHAADLLADLVASGSRSSCRQQWNSR